VLHTLIQAVGFGVAAGAVIALGAVGFSVQFGISNILNITYGALMTLAAYLGLFLVDAGLSAWVALPLVGIAVGVASVLFHRGLLAPLVRRGTRSFAIVIVTVAASIVLQYIIVAIVGPQAKTYGAQSGNTFHVLDVSLTAAQVTIILLTVALMLALHLLLTRTTLA